MIVEILDQCGRRHAVPGRVAPRNDAGWRSVWRRAAPTTRFARVPRRRGDRTAGNRGGLAVNASKAAIPSRAPWNKWGDPRSGGNRLCRERPLYGLQPRRERSRGGIGGNSLFPQSHADRGADSHAEDLPESVADRLLAAVSVALIGTRKCRRVARLPAPQGAAAEASGCASRTVAAALKCHGNRTCGRIGISFRLSNTYAGDSHFDNSMLSFLCERLRCKALQGFAMFLQNRQIGSFARKSQFLR